MDLNPLLTDTDVTKSGRHGNHGLPWALVDTDSPVFGAGQPRTSTNGAPQYPPVGSPVLDLPDLLLIQRKALGEVSY